MARPERFELPTTWFEARDSIQLSYGRFVLCDIDVVGTGCYLDPQVTGNLS